MIKRIFNCVSIHNGGGLMYLSLMHSEIDMNENLIFLDIRIKNKIKPFLNAEVIFLKKSLIRNLFIFIKRIKCTIRLYRARRNSNKFEFISEYYMNGIPPLFRFPISTNKVFILFQNRNLFSYLNYFNNKLFLNINFLFYHLIHSSLINLFLQDSDTIIVQTNSMRNLIISLKPKNKVLTNDNFWKNLTIDTLENSKETYQKGNTNKLNIINKLSKSSKLFFYPASFHPHKNHKILFKCFKKISQNGFSNLKLLVTISPNQLSNEFICNEQIIFLGNLPQIDIYKIYKIADFLIYPSLNESLGLPLIEASLNKLPIIASDLDYVYDVCIPSFTFNPYSEEDIYYKILDSLK